MPLIIHTDHGCQYVCEAWRQATEGMTRSYSHTGYLYDNAYIESFHSLIKREWLNHFTIRNYRQAYSLVFEYIEAFYNTVRIHSHCDYLSLPGESVFDDRMHPVFPIYPYMHL
ncbi:MAG: integrase core domain-containing protein [Lachnospiraceae bacterium]|nr:integrase core domain-containing protein [Lachnospiraceae bacterium]